MSVLSGPWKTTCKYTFGFEISHSLLILFELKFKKAEKALKYYKGVKGNNEKEEIALNSEFERLKSVVTKRKLNDKFRASDICKLTNFQIWKIFADHLI